MPATRPALLVLAVAALAVAPAGATGAPRSSTETAAPGAAASAATTRASEDPGRAVPFRVCRTPPSYRGVYFRLRQHDSTCRRARRVARLRSSAIWGTLRNEGWRCETYRVGGDRRRTSCLNISRDAREWVTFDFRT